MRRPNSRGCSGKKRTSFNTGVIGMADVLAFAEQRDGEIRGPAREAVSAASRVEPAPRPAFSSRARTQSLFNRSRISVSRDSSADGLGGGAGAASSFFFIEFMALTTMKMANAMMMKSTTV